jgi:hypothetical protein
MNWESRETEIFADCSFFVPFHTDRIRAFLYPLTAPMMIESGKIRAHTKCLFPHEVKRTLLEIRLDFILRSREYEKNGMVVPQ